MTPIIPSLSPLFDFLLPRNISGMDFGTGYGGTVCGFHTRPLTRKSQGLGSIPGLATYFRFFFRSRGAVVSYWRKYVHKVLVNHLEGLSLPRKSVVRLTDRPDMILDVYRGRKTTM